MERVLIVIGFALSYVASMAVESQAMVESAVTIDLQEVKFEV